MAGLCVCLLTDPRQFDILHSARPRRRGNRVKRCVPHMSFEVTDAVAALDIVIRSRKSVRAFRPDPVPRHLLTEILETARAAPSNFNSQPWRVYLLTGKAKGALGDCDPAGARCKHRASILALSATSPDGVRGPGDRL